jgi:hypothetical protein
MQPSRRARAAIAAVVLLVGLSACGSDDTDDDDATTTTEAAAGTTDAGDETTTTGSDDEGDDGDALARAEAANITIDDLPDGWTGEPPEVEENTAFDRCTDLDLDADTVAKAQSDHFEFVTGDGGQLTVSSTSGVLSGEDEATAMVDEFADAAFADCVTEALRTDLGATDMTGSLAVAPADELPDLADQTGGMGGAFTITDPTSGETIQLQTAVLAIRTGDLVTTVSVAAVDTEGDGELFESLAGLVAERQAG